MPTDEETRPERQQTDESLRVEREKADLVLSEKLSSFDEAADAVITRARARADEVLAKARARTDRSAPNGPPAVVVNERVRGDRAVELERATADEALSDKRAEYDALLVDERQATDEHLLTERERADDALTTRDEFLGVASHDLRSLLSSIVGFAELIACDAHDERIVNHAEHIQRAGTRMTRLIGDLVDIASMEAGKLAVRPELADPAEIVNEAVETFREQAAARGISLSAEVGVPKLVAEVDPARILQVLANILSNAIKFTAPGGRVLIRMDRIASDLRVCVTDTGEGIPADMLETVFERFRQVRQGDRRGMGLGLYISRCIVEGHGGRIWAESEGGGPGSGSRFIFTLPLPRAP